MGLVNVKRTETGIQVGLTTTTQMHRNLGSTAVLGSYYNGWDGDLYYDVVAIYGDAEQSLKVGRFQLNSQRTYVYDVGTNLQKPGQYHPLHGFQTTDFPGVLTAGTFGTSGANNYITSRLKGKEFL